MSLHCVDPKSHAVKDLAKELGLNPYIAAARIAVWQDKNGLDKWPVKDDLEAVSDTLNENDTTSPSSTESGTESLKSAPTDMSSVKFNLNNTTAIQDGINTINKFMYDNGFVIRSGNYDMSPSIILLDGESLLDGLDRVNGIILQKYNISDFYNIPSIKSNNNTINVNSKIYLINKSNATQQVTDLIERDVNEVSHTNLTSIVSHIYNKLKLHTEFGKKSLFKSIKEVAKDTLRTIAEARNVAVENVNALVKDGIVYFNRTSVQESVQLEEGLHPFVFAISLENPELFKKILDEAKRDFPKLALELRLKLSNGEFTENDFEQELVTQALVRYSQKSFREEGVNTIAREYFDSIASLIMTSIQDMSNMRMSVSEIKDTATLADLAKLINSSNISFTDNFKNGRALFSVKDNKIDVNKYQSKTIELDNIYDKIVNGLNAQLRSLKDRVDVSEYSKNRLKNIISNLDANNKVLTIIKSVQFINKELAEISEHLENIKITNGTITDSFLHSLNKDYFGFVNSLLDNENGLPAALKYCKEIKELSKKDLELLENIINSLKEKKSDLETDYKAISKGYVQDRLSEYSNYAGNIERTNILMEQLDNIDYDMSGWVRNMLMPSKAKDEVIRVVQDMLNDMDMSIHKESNKAKEKMMQIFFGLSKKNRDVSKWMYEQNDDKKFSGNIVSDFKRGEYEKAFEQHQKDLADDMLEKFGIVITDDKAPDNIIDESTGINLRKYFIDKRNSWKEQHEERRYTKEYYDMYNDLDPMTEEALEQYRHQMFEVIGIYINKDGRIRWEDVPDHVYAKYNALKKAKQNLASLYNEDGTTKFGKFKDIALDIQKLNKRKEGLVEFKKNRDKFEKTKNELKKTLSKDKFEKWLSRNSQEEYTQKFWDDLSSISTQGIQDDTSLELYKTRNELLKLYKIGNTAEINANEIPEDLKQKLRIIDLEIENKRTRVKGEKGELNFNDVAKIVTNKAYDEKHSLLSAKLEEAKKSNNKDFIDIAEQEMKDFLDYAFISYTVNGKVYTKIASIYSKMIPNPKKAYLYIDKEAPNENWLEMDPNSPLLNDNYTKFAHEAAFGPIPKVDKYYDPTRMNYIRNNKELLDYYNMTMYYMLESRNKIASIGKKNSYRLVQRSGTTSEQIARESNFIKKFRLFFKLSFGVNDRDKNELGGSDYKELKNADGSVEKNPAVHYVSDLENKDAISKDHLTNLLEFVHMANAHEYKKTMAPFMELLKEQVAKRKYTKTKIDPNTGEKINVSESKEGSTTENYKLLEYMIDRRLYNMTSMTKNENMLKQRVLKVVRTYVTGLIRKTALFLNPATLFGAFVEGTSKMHTEALIGSKFKGSKYFSVQDRINASREYSTYLFEAMKHTTNPLKKPKLEALMESNGIIKLTEETYNRNSKFKRTINSDSVFFVGYNQLDFSIKGHMLLSVYSSYRFDGVSFVTENEYITRQLALGRSKKEAETNFSLLTTTLYDAYEMDNAGELIVKKEYEDYIDSKFENRVAIKLMNLGQKLDGSLSHQDRVMAQDSIWGQFVLLFRSWMVVSANDRWSDESFNYSSGNIEMGSNKTAMFTLLYYLAKYSPFDETRFEKAKYRRGNEIDQANMARIGYDLAMRYAIPSLINYFILNQLLAEDDDSWLLWFLKYLMQRTAFEGTSVYNPGELVNILNSPSAATSQFELPNEYGKGLYRQARYWYTDSEEDRKKNEVPSGAYKGVTYLERAVIKTLPGRALFEMRNADAMKSKSNFLMNKLSSMNMLEALFGDIYDDDTTGDRRNERSSERSSERSNER